MRSGPAPILTRIAATIAVLVVCGLAAQLIAELCTKVLPPTFLQALSTGFQRIYFFTGPALPALIALLIIGVLIWIIIGKRR